MNQESKILLILGEMMFLNEGTLLENIRKRYYKNKIYVSQFQFIFYRRYIKQQLLQWV